MTGKTHRAGGVVACVIGYAALSKYGLLLDGAEGWIQLTVMYPFAVWGSVASDLDHRWESSPVKDGVGWLFNKLLHCTSSICERLNLSRHNVLRIFAAKHRSWQTHSDLVLAVVLVLLWQLLHGAFGLSGAGAGMLSLAVMGIGLGLISHLILDMLTPSGVWFVSFIAVNAFIGLFVRKKVRLLPEKVRFVPNTAFFSTGNGWEKIINGLLSVCGVLGVLTVIFINITGGIK